MATRKGKNKNKETSKQKDYPNRKNQVEAV